MSLYKDRVADGLCGHCGEKARDGKNTCSICAERIRKSKKINYHKRLDSGRCVDCGKPVSGSSRCSKCIDKQNASLYKYRMRRNKSGLCMHPQCTNHIDVGAKHCSEHLQEFRDKARERRQNRVAAGLCGCGRQRDSKDHIECEFCRESARISHNKSAIAVRDLVLTHYSGGPPSCACCGESIRILLSIDHIVGGGNKHRKAVTNGRGSEAFYRWLIKNEYPSGYQVLCRNCNYGKWANGGICPHVEQYDTTSGHNSAGDGPG